jgi:transposase
MSLYLVAGAWAPIDPVPAGQHLPMRRSRRYPSDTSDAEWQIMAAYVPAGGTGAKGGRPVAYPRRDVVDAIGYVDRTGCQWPALPADFPPWRTVYHYFRAWSHDGTLTRMHDGLRAQQRQAEGRAAQPTAAAVDSQSVRAAETVARSSRGYDAGKHVNGRKRHVAVDTCGLLLAVLITAASVQDRDAARTLLWALRACFPSFAWSGPTAATAAGWSPGPPPRSNSACRSSASSPDRSASRSCPDGGWPNAPSRGSTAAAEPSATTNACLHTTPRWSNGPWLSS